MASQLSFDLPVRTARGREDFFVAPCNLEAVEWVDRWPDWPTHALAIYGPPASGKSHLAHVWRARSGAATLKSSQVDRGQLPPGLSVGLVVEHDGRSFDEVALLHIYNAIAEAGGSLMLTAEEAPARWGVALPDLASRLRAATAVGIGRPDDALLAAVLAKLFNDRQLAVTPEVISFIMSQLERSLDAAQRCVAEIDAAALEQGRRVTVRLAAETLSEKVSISETKGGGV
jgi:chromosomal replication initiation ATPase DnaA